MHGPDPLAWLKNADFISETLAVFKAEMRSKKISYELKIEPSFAENNVDYVLTDPSRINQVVINMLTNAIKVSCNDQGWCFFNN